MRSHSIMVAVALAVIVAPMSYAQDAPDHRPGPGSGLDAARHRETAEVVPYDRSGRLFFHIVFWSALATSVELWWLNTPSGSINAVAVRTQDIRVRSRLIRVRSQEKWVSLCCTTPGLTGISLMPGHDTHLAPS